MHLVLCYYHPIFNTITIAVRDVICYNSPRSAVYNSVTHQVFELVVDKDSLHVQSHGACRGCEHISGELVRHLCWEENHSLDVDEEMNMAHILQYK